MYDTGQGPSAGASELWLSDWSHVAESYHGFFAKRKLNYTANIAWISTYPISTHCTRRSVQSVMESQVVHKLFRWDRKNQNPPAIYQINKGFLYYIQFIYKCHVWLAVVELLGKYISAFIFAALTISVVTSQFYLLKELSQDQVGERPCITFWFLHILFIYHSEPEAKNDWHEVFRGELSPALRYVTEMGSFQEKCQKMQYIPYMLHLYGITRHCTSVTVEMS